MVKQFRWTALGFLLTMALVVVMGLNPQQVSAVVDTCHWTGDIDGSASNPGNWAICDNGNLPETGDNLAFSSVSPNKNITWDLAITPRGINVNGPDYVFSGAPLVLSGNLGIQDLTTFQSDVIFRNSTGETGLSLVGTAQPVFNAGITMDITGAGYMHFYSLISSYQLPVIHGSASDLILEGLSGGSVEQYVSNANPQSFLITGDIYLTESNLQCVSNGCLGASSNVMKLFSNGGASLPAPEFQLNLAGLELDNPIEMSRDGSSQLPVVRALQDATLNGPISVGNHPALINLGSSHLTVNGDITIAVLGSLTISGSSGSTADKLTHTGSSLPGPGHVVVSNTTLIANGTNSFPGGIVLDGGAAKLGGNGSTGPVTMQASSILAPGTSPGCLTVASFTGNAAASFEQEIVTAVACTGYDQLNSLGAVDLNGMTLNLSVSGAQPEGTVYTIINGTSVSDTFGGLPDGSTITVGGQGFVINYTATTVTLTALAPPVTPPTPVVPPTPLTPVPLAAGNGQLASTGSNNLVYIALALVLIGAGTTALLVRPQNESS